jgi:hypothetical protein
VVRRDSIPRFGMDAGKSKCYKFVDRGDDVSRHHVDKHRGVRITYA